MAFKLGGGAVPGRAELDRSDVRSPLPPVYDSGAPAQIAAGREMFGRFCAVCHANVERTAPDLTRMNEQAHRDFLKIVLEGTRVERGMPKFGDVLSEKDARAIHAYVIREAWEKFRAGR